MRWRLVGLWRRSEVGMMVLLSLMLLLLFGLRTFYWCFGVLMMNDSL